MLVTMILVHIRATLQLPLRSTASWSRYTHQSHHLHY